MLSIRTWAATLAIAAVAAVAGAADYTTITPTSFAPDDPRTKDLPKTMAADMRQRMQAANLRESKAFAAIATKQQWEKYRHERIQALRASLGTFPPAPKDVPVAITRELAGENFVIRNIVYQSRPGFWVTANLYLPAKPPAKMPGILIAHAHHTAKTHGELQDMGMTWARTGCAVLVIDQIGYGERREHEFNSEKDYPKPYRASRQDYYFRYNSNLQLSAIGDSLMGWMVWDLMRGIDVLLKQPNIDKDRIILLGSVAGGGDPAGVTAALDERVACVVPFNFGGWQPESNARENPDRDNPWFGDGYWESTRGLRNGARDGFAHFVIVGSVAPRKVIYAHEFAWDANADPAWPRLQKIFSFYDAKKNIVPVHGKGSVRGPGGPDNTHCTHIGAMHRKEIHPALQEWFGIAIPEEYSNRRPSADLMCWTDEARKALQPKTLRELVATIGKERRTAALAHDAKPTWAKLLGTIEPIAKPEVTEGKTEAVAGGRLARFALEADPGIMVPLFVITPTNAKAKAPAVVMVAQHGKAAFLKERGEAIELLLKAGVVVCLVDVRGTGETKPGTSADRGSSRTSVSQTNLILGQPVLGSQLRDLRTVIRWLQGRDAIDGKRLAVWGDSFAAVNNADTRIAVPHDAEQPAVSEPGGANLALLTALFEPDIIAVYARGGLRVGETFATEPYLFAPHDAVIPGPVQVAELAPVLGKSRAIVYEGEVDAQNHASGKARSVTDAAVWVAEQLRAK